MLREGSPFMEFLSVVAMFVLCCAALFMLALHPESVADVRGFFTHAAETLLGAVIALAYAARGVVNNGNNNTTISKGDGPGPDVDKKP